LAGNERQFCTIGSQFYQGINAADGLCQCILDRHSIAQMAEQQGCENIARAARAARKIRRIDKPGAVVGDRQRRDPTIGSYPRCNHGSRSAITQMIRGDESAFDIVNRASGQMLELESIWQCNIRQRQKHVPESRRQIGLDIKARVPIAHDRIAEEERMRAGRFDTSHPLSDDLGIGSGTEIAAEDGAAFAQKPERREPLCQCAKFFGRSNAARVPAVAWMIRQHRRVDGPDSVAHTLQEQLGCAVADMAINDFGRKRE